MRASALASIAFAVAGCVPRLPECARETQLSIAPLRLSDFIAITPLGNLNPPSHTFPTDHLYFELRGGDEGTASVPVVAPGHVWITRIAETEFRSATDHRRGFKLELSPCRHVRLELDHVQSLAPSLARRATGPGARCEDYEVGGGRARQCARNVWIEVKAGEAIGTAGGGERALDFGGHDDRAPEPVFARPERRRRNLLHMDDLHVVCPIDYFQSAIAEGLRARLGGTGAGEARTVEPRCGRYAQDVPGTAQGLWYLKTARRAFPEDPHLALVRDNVLGAQGALSIGTGLDGEAGVFYFAPAASGVVNTDFARVTADGQVRCYETHVRGRGESLHSFLLQMTDSSSLRLERRGHVKCGAGPFAMTGPPTDPPTGRPTGGALYER